MAKQRSKKVRTARSKNPPRGGPGILVISETGREIKCQREALEIIRHYFYKQQEAHVTVPSTSLANDTPDLNHQQKEGGKSNESKEAASNVSLSLEEEIAMLQKGASADAVLAGSSDSKGKAPFRVYDTGCRGMVFIMCTIPSCELIETTISTAKAKHVDDADNDACENTTGKNGGDKTDGGLDKDKNASPQDVNVNETSSTLKRKQDEEVLSTSTDLPSDNIQLKAKKQKIGGGGDGDGNGGNDDKKWDPISTVQSIFQDIREQNTEAPRSRFVNRMVPMQATCFASMDEIEANVRELIKTFLLPRGVDHMHQREHDKDIADDKGVDNLPSFKIEFKHRNCTHIRRDQVVESIAGIIQDLTNEYWNNMCKDGASSEETMEEKKKALFRVDLSNPHYTIIIEICRTLCGMSVVSNATSFKNFNLLMAQEEVDARNGNGVNNVK